MRFLLLSVLVSSLGAAAPSYLESFKSGFLKARQEAREKHGIDLTYRIGNPSAISFGLGEWAPPGFSLTQRVDVIAALNGGEETFLGVMDASRGPGHEYTADEVYAQAIALLDAKLNPKKKDDSTGSEARLKALIQYLVSYRATAKFKAGEDPYENAVVVVAAFLKEYVLPDLEDLRLEDDPSQVVFGTNPSVGKKIILYYHQGAPVEAGRVQAQALGVVPANVEGVTLVASEIGGAVIRFLSRESVPFSPRLLPPPKNPVAYTPFRLASFNSETETDAWLALEKKAHADFPHSLPWDRARVQNACRTGSLPYSFDYLLAVWKGERLVAALAVANPYDVNPVGIRRLIIDPRLVASERSALAKRLIPALIQKPFSPEIITESRTVVLPYGDRELRASLQDWLPANFTVSFDNVTLEGCGGKLGTP